MTTLVLKTEPLAAHVEVDEAWLTVHLRDGRLVAVPLGWYPRLQHGTPAERARWRLVADGEGITWPALDEDIEVQGLLEGRRSGESARSFARWLAARAGRSEDA